MAETFLILLAGGVMLAAVVSHPEQVTLLWLRLCGLIALAMAGLGLFFLFRRADAAPVAARWAGIGLAAAVLGQLAFVQMAWRKVQRGWALVAFLCAAGAGTCLLRCGNQADLWRGTVFPLSSAVGISAMSGLILMEMLLGHAYLTASKMTMRPFRRLNLVLAGVLVWRAVMSVGVALLALKVWPIYMFWGIHGLYVLTRWLVGLAVPAVFVYMADDCIRRRATQSATGILYVASVLVFIGEIVATYLVRATGLPF